MHNMDWKKNATLSVGSDMDIPGLMHGPEIIHVLLVDVSAGVVYLEPETDFMEQHQVLIARSHNCKGNAS